MVIETPLVICSSYIRLMRHVRHYTMKQFQSLGAPALYLSAPMILLSIAMIRLLAS